MRDLRSLLARVNAAGAQPGDTKVIAPGAGVEDYLELRVVHPRGDPHLTVSYRTGDVYVFWTGGHVRDAAWMPRHLLIVECLLTGRNNLEVRRSRSRIVSTTAEFWPPSGERVGPLHSDTPPPPGIGRKLAQRARGLRRGSSTTTYHQVSFERADPVLSQLEPFRPPSGKGPDA